MAVLHHRQLVVERSRARRPRVRCDSRGPITVTQRSDAGKTAAQVEERSSARKKDSSARAAPVFHRGAEGLGARASFHGDRDAYAPLRRAVEERHKQSAIGVNGNGHMNGNGNAREHQHRGAAVVEAEKQEPQPMLEAARASGAGGARVESFWEWSPPPNGDDELIFMRETSIAKPSIELLRQAALRPTSTSSEGALAAAEVEGTKGDNAIDDETEAEQQEEADRRVPPSLRAASHVWDAASTEDVFSSATRVPAPAVGAAGDTRTSGIEEDGSRWWREAGSEEIGNGRLRRWVCLRGTSSAGDLEWEQRWWETSDADGFRELGAEKSGRDRDGNVWRENWLESLDMRDGKSAAHIERCADKWARAPDMSEWHETWVEEFTTTGAVKRSADKWGCKGPGAIPEDGHANRWQERWGEDWDGNGNVTKWTDKWAERDQAEGGGPPRAWGDKWEERNSSASGTGSKNGETWTTYAGDRWTRSWGEEHFSGRLHKFGHSTCGEHWDEWQDETTWFEARPNFGWDDAIRHSPQLLAVPLRARDGKSLLL